MLKKAIELVSYGMKMLAHPVSLTIDAAEAYLARFTAFLPIYLKGLRRLALLGGAAIFVGAFLMIIAAHFDVRSNWVYQGCIGLIAISSIAIFVYAYPVIVIAGTSV